MIDDTGTTSYTYDYTLDAVGNRTQMVAFLLGPDIRRALNRG